MKRFLISMAALLAVVGCAKQEDLVSADLGTVDAPEFQVGFETSRVFIDEDSEGYKLSWTKGDLLSCFLNTGGQAKYEFTGETGADNGIIKAVSCPAGTLLDSFYAIYPYHEGDALNDGVLSLTLPAEQVYTEDTFDPNSNTMVAVNADAEPYYLFSNICGYFRLKVYGNACIKSIKIEGNNGEVIAGAATYDTTGAGLSMTGNGKAITLTCGEGITVGKTAEEATDFWFVIPAATFEKGFKVSITDVHGHTSIKNLIDAYEVVRNQVKSAELQIDHGFSSTIFDAKFNLDGTATDVGTYGFNIQTIAGEFMSVVEDGDYGNVAKFTQGPTNSPQNHSYFYVDYSADTEANNAFKADLENGFTMEVVASCGEWSNDPWQYCVAGNTFGLLHVGLQSYARIMGCADTNKNNQFNDMTQGNGYDPLSFRVDTDKYHHYIYVWDAVMRHIRLFVDGILYLEGPGWGVAAGHRLAIGGYPAYVNDAPEIRMPYDGKIATARIYSDPMTKEQVEFRAKELNFNDDSVVEPGNVLFDAKFEGTTATNVGTMQSLVIDNSLLGSGIVSAVKRGTKDVVKFYRSSKNNNATAEGAYLIDYTNNADFKATLTDGFTMEVLCKVNHYNGDFWSKVMAGTCWGIQHIRVDLNAAQPPQYGLFANAQENKWTTAPEGGWQFGWQRYLILSHYDHLLFVYDQEIRATKLYLNGKLLYQVSYSNEFNPGNMMAIGGLPYTDKTFFHPFVGEIAMARIYDNKCNENWAKSRYDQLLPTIQELNSAAEVVVPAPMIDVRFNTDETATDIVSNCPIEAVINENTLSVVSPTSNYSLNNIAQYRPITDADGAPITSSYFKLSYETLPELQKAMDDGLSVEVIYSSVNRPYDVWQGLYGNETIRLHALGWRYNGAWTMWLTDTNAIWYYNGDSALKPGRSEAYYHNIYIRNNETKEYALYTNGRIDYHKVMDIINPVSTNMYIGASGYVATELENRPFKLDRYWQGNIALFRIYDEPLTLEQVMQAFANVKPQLDALNEGSFIK